MLKIVTIQPFVKTLNTINFFGVKLKCILYFTSMHTVIKTSSIFLSVYSMLSSVVSSSSKISPSSGDEGG